MRWQLALYPWFLNLDEEREFRCDLDGQIEGPSNLHNLQIKNASGKRLAFLFIAIGGDGGGSNSPSRKGSYRMCYRLSRLFALTQRTLPAEYN